MTVLIAATDDVGVTVRDRLRDAGFDVERVTILSTARTRAATADVVVVGDLEDGTARELRTAVHADEPVPPFVHLGADEAFDTTVERPVDTVTLVSTVRLAARTGQYRRAVDDLYERCRERAAAGDANPTGDEAVARAKRRAERQFQEARSLHDGPPFEQLFGSSAAQSDEEAAWFDLDDTDGLDGDLEE